MTRFLFLFIAAVFVSVAHAETLTFDQALQYIVDHHPDIFVEQTKWRQAQDAVAARKFNFLPHLSLSASQTQYPDTVDGYAPGSTTNSLGITTSINIFRAGADLATVSAAANDEAAEANQVNVTRLSAEDQAAKILFTFIASQQKIEILKKSSGTFEEALTIARERYKKGLLPLQEADKASVDLANALARVSDAEIEAQAARADLQRFIPENFTVTFDWPWKKRLQEPNVAQQLVKRPVDYNARPDFRALSATVDAEEARSSAAFRQMWPSLDFSASYGINQTPGGPWNLGNSLVLSLSMDVFDALQNKMAYHIQQETLFAAQIKLEQLKRDIDSFIKGAQRTFQVALDTAKEREKTLAVSQRLYDTNLRRLQQGRAPANEVALDQQRLTDSELLDLQGWSAAHQAFVSLCHALGHDLKTCQM